MSSKIIGTGHYTPSHIVKNTFFQDSTFFDENEQPLKQSNEIITQKLKEITGIEERRYAMDDQVASDLGFQAA